MKVILLKEFYGHCPGLERSFRIATELIGKAKKDGKKIYYDVPLAHNVAVLEKLKQDGFTEINIDGTENADKNYFVISAHGVSPSRIKELEKKNFEVVVATCPTVTRLHRISQKDYTSGYQIVIFGKAQHPEIKGANGCIDNSAIIVSSVADASNIKLSKKASVICQTTLSASKFAQFVENLKEANPSIEIVTRDTICPIVEGRVQKILKYIQKNKPDRVLVVGSAHSSNTRQLAANINETVPAEVVDGASEIDFAKYHKDTTILVVSGTSAPPEVVEEVASRLNVG